eukprot:Plantae.Rhodophyta-Rhodochaete_pulchella.ctg2623.p2 GENE.Plantae.Rhodophyta-Rhodochaete_pulchella.ctg2623~~Plantae.Rhodophyta-Rhodochaete_pulchella.ctg2623.p2  ORF type:complete len:135 (-),score=33.08 Plantae.Rhodophyta-Rhodochaete_pulchella.ctg2623:7-411(-)
MPALYIISPDDRMVFEEVFPEDSMVGKQMVVAQLVVNAALDMVDEVMWANNQMNLRVVDRFNDHVISAFVTAGNFRFMLLHDGRSEEGIKQFFVELYELFVKVVMNPLHDESAPITNKVFRERVNQLARKLLVL